MDVRAYLRHFIDLLHANYVEALAGMDDEQLYFRPTSAGNHIAFSAWHLVRTEDNVVQFVLQRQSTVWLKEGLDASWALPRVAQGTGMDPVDAYALRLPSLEAFLDYAHTVWAGTDAYLSRVTDEELARVTKVQPFGEIPVLQALGQVLIAHGNQHLGEVWLTKQLQGLPSSGL